MCKIPLIIGILKTVLVKIVVVHLKIVKSSRAISEARLDRGHCLQPIQLPRIRRYG